jgi:predicted heme/steroid binding protein
MAQTYELTQKMYEDCYRNERSKNKPTDEYNDILTRPDFQELTKNLFENHDEYCLTEGEVYDINDKYFRWDGQKMVAIPDAEVTETMIDDRTDITSAHYAKIFEQKYEDETEEKMPDFKDIEEVPHFGNWVKKTLEFMKYEPAHGDIIDVACNGYRNQGKYQWNDTTKKLVYLFTNIDDYGSCNPIFRVGNEPGEFPPWHWHATSSCPGPGFTIHYGAIDHNTIVFLSEKLITEINTKLESAKDRYKCEIDIRGVTYKVNTSKKPLEPTDVYDCSFSYDHGYKTLDNY